MRNDQDINCEVSVSAELRKLLGASRAAVPVERSMSGEGGNSVVVSNGAPFSSASSEPFHDWFCFRKDGDRPLKLFGVLVAKVTGRFVVGRVHYDHTASVVLADDQSLVLAFSLCSEDKSSARPIFDCARLSENGVATFVADWVAKLSAFAKVLCPDEPVLASRAFDNATQSIFRKMEDPNERKSTCPQ